MKEGGSANLEMAASYRDLLVNRGAYTIQSSVPDAGGKHYYYRPKDRRRLKLETVRDHLNGLITVGLYAIDPRSQCSKWLAVDADYATALNDLLKVRHAMRESGLEPALEQSRRGAHLWVFGAEPLPAHCWRLYIHNLALKLGIPIKKDKTEGIEIFPRQDELRADEFGNAIRGPLGIHRATKKRYWFYDAAKNVTAQMEYLTRLNRVQPLDMERLTDGLTMPEEFQPKPNIVLPPSDPTRNEFRILNHITGKLRRQGRDYRTRCPSCALKGGDRRGHKLAILIADPRTYRCWGGCSKEEIRAAVGCPIRYKRVG